MSYITYENGISGFVALQGSVATKHSIFNELYWLSEHTILLYLWYYQTDSIVRFSAGEFVIINGIKYYKTVMPRYPSSLTKTVLHREVEIMQIFLDLSSALKFLHACNIMHRDIKPGNVMLTRNGHAVLIDFSHSIRLLHPDVKLTHNVFSLSYRPPEVHKRLTYDFKADVWSLGMLIISLITKKSYMCVLEHISDDQELHDKYMEIIDDPEFYEKIKHFYFTNGPDYLYKNAYWNLIKKMIEIDSADRISMADVYEGILQFNHTYKLNLKIPINGKKLQEPIDFKLKEDYSSLKFQPIVDRVESVYESSKKIFAKYYKQLKMRVSIDFCYKLIKHMCIELDITRLNYRDMCVGLVVILNNLLEDQFVQLSEYIPAENAEDTHNCIINIMKKYDAFICMLKVQNV